MKKFIPYIFTFLILANFLAPFSMTMVGGKTRIQKEVAYADPIKITADAKHIGNSVNINIVADFDKMDSNTKQFVHYYFKNIKTQEISYEFDNEFKMAVGGKNIIADKKSTLTAFIRDFKGKKITEIPIGTEFELWISVYQKENNNNLGSILKVNQDGFLPITIGSQQQANDNLEQYKKEQQEAGAIRQAEYEGGNYNFTCYLAFWSKGGTMAGCFTDIFDFLFWLSSKIFALAGMFFDWTLGYTLDSDSYRATFVTEGWGVVRDTCNVFFIFVLLYVAFATVLGIHGFNTKSMIVNVVIIGLLINFSLFATQVIIDTSNILARVFYNSIDVNVDKNSKAIADTGVDATLASKLGEKHISAAILDKIQPQKLLLNAEQFNTKDGKTESNNISAGTYLFITFLMIVMCILGTIVFLSVGLIFIARVIGLWIAMVLVPFTFFSYTVPSLQSVEMVGWKKWWPETLSLAFLAPVFMFFLYLILQFLNTGLGIFEAEKEEGIQFVMAIMIPFAFLMIMLWKAKDIAKKMSGAMGQQITGALTAAAGLALGGAALGAAFVGRQTVGSFMRGASTGDTYARRLEAERLTGVRDPNLNRLQRGLGRLSSGTGIDRAQQWMGRRLNTDQANIEHAAHARHELDAVAGQIAHGKKWDELTGNQRYEARRKLERDRMVRLNQGNAAAIAGTEGFVVGLGALQSRKWDSLTQAERDAIDAAIGAGAHGAVAGGRLATNTTYDDRTTIHDARRKQGIESSFMQSTVTGNFDMRDISKIKVGEQDRWENKLITGITSNIASGIRGGFKNVGAGLNYGEGQKDFFKDLGHTITEALKSASVKVDLSHVGEEHKEDHGGGGHH